MHTLVTVCLMQMFLSKGGDLPSIDDLGQPALLLLQWVKTDQALLMLFSNGTLQVCAAGMPQPLWGEKASPGLLQPVYRDPSGCEMLLWCHSPSSPLGGMTL